MQFVDFKPLKNYQGVYVSPSRIPIYTLTMISSWCTSIKLHIQFVESMPFKNDLSVYVSSMGKVFVNGLRKSIMSVG